MKCEICGLKIKEKGIYSHLKYKHNITIKEYYDKYLKTDVEGICPVCGKETKFLGISKGYQTHCSISCSQLNVEVQNRKKLTNLKKYGYESTNQVPSIKQKQRNSIFIKYGVYNIQQIPEVSKKSINTRIKHNLQSIGVEHCTQLPEVRKKISDSVKKTMSQFSNEKISSMYIKQRESKRKNGTLSTSSDEERFYEWLCNYFNKKDIYRNYNKDERYPFQCDFYIKPLDLFIELNLYFTHGGHWFDKNSIEDVERLQWLINKTKNEKHPQYEANIKVWTVSDPLKREYAIKNNLNYIVLWNEEDIKEFKEVGIYEWI